ncbi:hypothetical protein HYC85_026923 [Camellia sinensis]|uniref:Uncharacterized protein n=1 Tax=Camellia sinensis TaxID=4442 RepID=A0A7J7G8V6_CAMSI|nr:hypothetical protein HYC85_026923 [Camellia sinensis]
MSSRQLFPDMQQNQYLENDRVCLDGHRDSFHCSNFWDVDWLSSSGNSCEEETYERSMLIRSPITSTSSGNVVIGLKMESGASASTFGSSMKVSNILNLSGGTVMTWYTCQSENMPCIHI